MPSPRARSARRPWAAPRPTAGPASTSCARCSPSRRACRDRGWRGGGGGRAARPARRPARRRRRRRGLAADPQARRRRDAGACPTTAPPTCWPPGSPRPATRRRRRGRRADARRAHPRPARPGGGPAARVHGGPAGRRPRADLDRGWLEIVAAVRPAVARLEAHQLRTPWPAAATDPARLWSVPAASQRDVVVYGPGSGGRAGRRSRCSTTGPRPCRAAGTRPTPPSASTRRGRARRSPCCSRCRPTRPCR